MNRGQRTALTVGAIILAVVLHVLFVRWETAEGDSSDISVVERALVELAARHVGVEIIFDIPVGEITVLALTKGGTGRTSAILLGLVAPLALVIGAIMVGALARTRDLANPPAAPPGTESSTGADTTISAATAAVVLRRSWRWLRYPVMVLVAVVVAVAILFAWLQMTI